MWGVVLQIVNAIQSNLIRAFNHFLYFKKPLLT